MSIPKPFERTIRCDHQLTTPRPSICQAFHHSGGHISWHAGTNRVRRNPNGVCVPGGKTQIRSTEQVPKSHPMVSLHFENNIIFKLFLCLSRMSSVLDGHSNRARMRNDGLRSAGLIAFGDGQEPVT